MFHGKGKIAMVLVLVLALLFSTAPLSLAATRQANPTGALAAGMCPGSGGGSGTGTGWGCGNGWAGGQGIGWCNGMWGGQTGARGTQFMAHGKVVSVSTATSEITVTLDAASPNLLTKLNITKADLPMDLTFQMSATVKVWGCGWHQGKWGSGTVTLAGLQAGNGVNLMGYFDKTTGNPVVSRINVWYY